VGRPATQLAGEPLRLVPLVRRREQRDGLPALLRGEQRLAEPAGVFRDDAVRRVEDQDRKSTRLNSRHLVISYAVFCLKNKKKYHHHSTYQTLSAHAYRLSYLRSTAACSGSELLGVRPASLSMRIFHSYSLRSPVH